MLKTLIPAALLAAVLVAPASALPLAPLPAPDTNVVQVYGGCGPYGHRGPYGGCRPGGQRGGYFGRACPRGFHLGRGGRRCWPN
ncbi:GCG_CRPN prefix-to-repeats domain-containing protein [Methylobacterium sp. A54F]